MMKLDCQGIDFSYRCEATINAKERYCFEVRVFEKDFFATRGVFFNPRFLFTQKENKTGKGHFIELLNKHKFMYVRRRISSEIKGFLIFALRFNFFRPRKNWLKRDFKNRAVAKIPLLIGMSLSPSLTPQYFATCLSIV